MMVCSTMRPRQRQVAARTAVDLRRMNIISTPRAPKPVAAYSQAIEASGFIFCSGQIGLDAATGKLAPDFSGQAEQVFTNLAAVLAAAGSGFDRAVKVSIFLVDLSQFSVVNEIYERHMGAHYPTRTTVGCGSLPLGALIEVDVVAVK
jgi:2-iminobutanoate/2-iminopropanoate deaminase